MITLLFRDVIELLSLTYVQNQGGDNIPVPVSREVYANKQSVRQSEHYQAAATGLKPELMFEVFTTDYQGESTLRFEGTEYDVIRTYPKKNERTELICKGMTA